MALSLDFHTSLQLPEFFYYYYFNTAVALFLKSAALEQFFSDVSWLPALCLKTGITKSSKELPLNLLPTQ